MNKHKNQRRQLPLWPFLLLIIAAAIFLWKHLNPAPKNDAPLSGAGYQSISEVNGKLYLIEPGGNIYTMNWETGEKTHLCSAPETVSWVSSPDMTALYYIESGQLHRTDISTGTDTPLNTENAFPMEIEIVTEDYLLFRQGNRFAEYAIMCLDLETMESSCILSANEVTSDEKTSKNVVIVPGEDNKAYAYFSHDSIIEYPDQSKYWIEMWDLVTGERTVLVETTDYVSFLESGTTYNEHLYYKQENMLWRVPTDGSGKSEYLFDLGHRDIIASVFLNTEGKIIYDARTTVERSCILCCYDINTGETTPFCNLGNATIHGVYSSGNKYAVWYWKNSKKELLLSNLPDESTPSMTDQIYSVLPDMMTALEITSPKSEAEDLSIGQAIQIYRVENSDPVRGDTDVYPIYNGDHMVALAYPCLHETGEYTFTLGEDYAKELETFLHETQAERIALAVDCNGTHCIANTGEQQLLSEHYTDLTSKIDYLTKKEIEYMLRPFSIQTRIEK